MKTLYLECKMGAAGDMLTAALLELLPKPERMLERLNGLGIPGVTYHTIPMEKCGIRCTHVSVTVDGEEEESEDVPVAKDHVHESDHAHDDHGHEHHHDHGHDHHHDHDDHHHDHDDHHDHAHHHEHRSLHDIMHLIDDLALPAEVRKDALAVYRLLAEAESRVHGMSVQEIHFHEVGTLDAVADVVAVCLLIHELAP
ncbi:MAG: DUF111 family protein, partial [Butyrivibrio sp.]|nr:DUF111 family protein [Butyrivibrio sp.]